MNNQLQHYRTVLGGIINNWVWVFVLLMMVMWVLDILDVFTAFHWLGHSGLLCELATNILVMMTVTVIGLSALFDDDSRTYADKKSKSKIGMFIMSLIGILIIGYCCYNAYYIVLDLANPPVTKAVTLKQAHDYVTRGKYSHHHEEVVFIEDGVQRSIEMPYSMFFNWSVGSVSELNHILSFPREAELTYYPNTDTVDTIVIHGKK